MPITMKRYAFRPNGAAPGALDTANAARIMREENAPAALGALTRPVGLGSVSAASLPPAVSALPARRMHSMGGDLAGQMPEIPQVPEYQPLAREQKTGFKNRLKGFLQGMLETAYATGGNPIATLTGGVAGAVNRDYPERARFERWERPRAIEEQGRALAIRKQMASEAETQSQMAEREFNAETNRLKAETDWSAPVTQGEILLRRDASGNFIPVTADGQPVRNAAYARGLSADATSRANAEMLDARAREIADANNQTRLVEQALQDEAAMQRLSQQLANAVRLRQMQEGGENARKTADLMSYIGEAESAAEPGEAEVQQYLQLFGGTREAAVAALRQSRAASGAKTRTRPNAQAGADFLKQLYGKGWQQIPAGR